MSAIRTLLRSLASLGACSAMACGRGAPAPAPGDVDIAAQAEAAAPEVSRAEEEGLSLEFTLRPVDGGAAVAGSDAIAEIAVTDAATGAPVRGLSPLGWMSLRTEEPCRAKVKGFMAGLLSRRPEVDMNESLVWTLNGDSTVSAIDPQIAFSRTKLRSVVSLAAPGVAAALHPDNGSLFVTLAGGRGVALVDTRRGLVRRNIAVGRDPSRVAIAPDGRTVWVGNDGDGTVSVLDARSGEPLKTLDAGPGHHEIAFVGGGAAVWITSSRGSAVTVVDGAALSPIAEIPVGEGASAIAGSDAAAVVHVANAARGEVMVLDAARRAVIGRVPLRPGLGALAFDPRGRFSFALNPAADEVAILDAATGAAAHTLRGLAAPDAVIFTEAFAYIRNRGAPRVSLVDRAALGGASPPPVVHVAVGQGAPGGGEAAPMAPNPEGRGAIIASPADRALYYYAEGMMAPLGSIPSYGRAPKGVFVEDRSLKEVRPGVYSTVVRLGPAGPHDVAILLDRPRAAICLTSNVAPPPGGAGARSPDGITWEPLFDPDLWLPAGAPATLRFRASAAAGDPRGPLDPKEMEIMIVRFPAGYRWSGAPRAEEDGALSVTFTPPAAGQYRLLVAAPGRGAPLGASAPVALRVFADAAGDAGGGAR